MSLSLPPAEMLETPPGYPFEEINYEDIEVEEVTWDYFCCFSCHWRMTTVSVSSMKLLPSECNFDANYLFSGGGERSFWGRLQSKMERKRCCNQDY